MSVLLTLLLTACGGDPPPPPEPSFDWAGWTETLCTATGTAGVPLDGAMPERTLPGEPGAPWPRLRVAADQITWNALPASVERLPERLARHPVEGPVVIQAPPGTPISTLSPWIQALRTAGVQDLRAAVRAPAPAVPEPPDAALATRLESQRDPRRRMGDLSRAFTDAIEGCGHAELALTLAETEQGDRCDVWRRQLVPSAELCPDLDAPHIATLLWVMEHPAPDSWWATVAVPDTLPEQGTWDEALPRG